MIKEKDKKETMSKAKKTTKKKTVSKKEIITPEEVTSQKLKNLDGRFLLVKVGDKDRPASDEDIQEIETKLVALLEENNIDCVAFVTHHAVEMYTIN